MRLQRKAWRLRSELHVQTPRSVLDTCCRAMEKSFRHCASIWLGVSVIMQAWVGVPLAQSRSQEASTHPSFNTVTSTSFPRMGTRCESLIRTTPAGFLSALRFAEPLSSSARAATSTDGPTVRLAAESTVGSAPLPPLPDAAAAIFHRESAERHR